LASRIYPRNVSTERWRLTSLERVGGFALACGAVRVVVALILGLVLR
jgi:hypothetical protein